MSQTVKTQFGTGEVVDRDSVRGRVSYKVEGPGFSTWIEASAMPLDFQWMPGPDDIQDNSVTLPYNPKPQTYRNPAEQNIVPGDQGINPQKRTSPADSLSLQEESENYLPGPNSKLFAQEVQAKLGPKYVNAFVEHDFSSLQARITENPEIVLAEYREKVAELVAAADPDYLEQVGRNEFLEASDTQLREAAWKDVRSKATRLRRSGQINTRAATPDVIAAQVTGDHGTYEVIVTRSNVFTGSSAVDSWSCECPWGQWAFQREHTFVGRLCSHAYATLLELQAMVKSKARNPKFRNQPAIWASVKKADVSPETQASYDLFLKWCGEAEMNPHNFSSLDYFTYMFGPESGEKYRALKELWQANADASTASRTAAVNWVENPSGGFSAEFYDGQHIEVMGDGSYEVSGGGFLDAGQASSVEEAKEEALDRLQFFSTKEADIVDLRPVGWDPYSRGLMNQLHDLWEEGSRPGKQKQRNEEIRNLVTELRDRGFAVDGIMASLKKADLIPKGTRLQNKNEEHDKVWVSTGEPGNTGLPGAGTFFCLESNPDIEKVISSGDQDYYNVLSSREGFIDRPNGYGDIPDYGTGLDYILEHEIQHREDVTEPEFEYEAGGDHGIVNDINDGGGEKLAGYEDDYQYGEPPAYGSGDEYGGDENPYYVDPAEQEDWDNPLPESEDDVIANFQRNAGWLMGNDTGSSGGNDDIAAAAQAHLRTAGRNFTMAEQQALIDEDDGQPYDRSGLRLRGTHYEGGGF